MQADSGLYIRFILSAKAGRGYKDELPEKIRRIFAEAEAEAWGRQAAPPDIQTTQYKGHPAELAREWAERYGDRAVVYIGGGDGSLNETAHALAGTDCAMGVLPMGTGNDFARSLYPGLSARQALKKVLPLTPNPDLTRIDLLKVNGHHCLNVLSMGYDTVVLQQAYDFLEKWPSLGRAAYGLAVLKTGMRQKHYLLHYRFEAEDGGIMEDELPVSIAVMGNGGHYGSGFNPCPYAKLDDGLGDFLIAEKLKLIEFIPLLPKFKKGRHLPNPKMRHFRFKKGLIEAPDGTPFPANYDGEIFQSTRLELEMCPGKLRFARLLPFKNS